MNYLFLFFYLLLLIFPWFDPVCAGAAPLPAQTLDFIYVNANTGEAAGGHAALRLGSTLFHFQFFPQGHFLLVRDSWSHFRYVYNELRNRSIYSASLPLSSQQYTTLRNHFVSLLVAQQQDLEQLKNAQKQLQLIRELAKGVDRVTLPTVGLFDRNPGEDKDLFLLYQMMIQKIGRVSFAAMFNQVKLDLATLLAESKQKNSTFFSARLQELLLEREFFQIMNQGRGLDPKVIFSPTTVAELAPDEVKVLKGYREQLADSISSLLQSSRFDYGEALLLQTARFLIVSRSLSAGKLLTLDPFSSDALQVIAEQGQGLINLHKQLQRDGIRVRHDFFRETVHPDITYALLETTQGRLHEVAGALHRGLPVRVEQGILLPVRSGTVPVSWQPEERDLFVSLLVSKEAEVLHLQQQLKKRYTYDLIRKNCATELIRTINSAFATPEIGRRALGGWLDPDNDPVFIPHQFFTLVEKRYPVTAQIVFPSHRLRELSIVLERGSSTWWQELNTLSSSLYVPRAEDTPFLFFTDDTLVLRPLLGISNLCWAAVHSLTGVFTLPVDGGDRMYQGVRGILYSLPELFFSNIRKGTYGYAEVAPASP